MQLDEETGSKRMVVLEGQKESRVGQLAFGLLHSLLTLLKSVWSRLQVLAGRPNRRIFQDLRHPESSPPDLGLFSENLLGNTKVEPLSSGVLHACVTAIYCYLCSKAAELDFTFFSNLTDASRTEVRPIRLSGARLDFVLAVAMALQGLSNPKITMRDVLGHVLTQYGITPADLPIDKQEAALQYLFASCGWLTMLYEPQKPVEERTFRINSWISSGSPQQSTLSAQRPLVGMFLGFGKLLPYIGREDNSVLIRSSTVSFYTLKTIGKVKIVWTNSASSHLSFDARSRRLNVFRLPSFCALCCLSENVKSMVDRFVCFFLDHSITPLS